MKRGLRSGATVEIVEGLKAGETVAVDGAGNLYVADTQSHTIRKVVISSGVVTTVAGLAAASGCRPVRWPVPGRCRSTARRAAWLSSWNFFFPGVIQSLVNRRSSTSTMGVSGRAARSCFTKGTARSVTAARS